MNTKVLITYATVSGSTREIAERIQAELKTLDIDVDLLPCREVKALGSYSTVVLGAPIYMFRLHKDAVQFLHRRQKELSRLPVAVFAGGPYGENVVEDSLEVRKNLQSELGKFSWLHPAAVLLVGGRFHPALLRFPYNLIPALKGMPPSDARDWEEICAWARSLPALADRVEGNPV